MEFLIGFNLAAWVLWYLYICTELRDYPEADLPVKVMVTIVMEILTIIFTTGIYLMVNAFWYK